MQFRLDSLCLEHKILSSHNEVCLIRVKPITFSETKNLRYSLLVVYLFRFFIGGVALTLLMNLSFAQTTDQPSLKLSNASFIQHLSLSEALTLAEKNNPQLIAARSNIQIGQVEIGIAKQRINPQLQIQHYWGTVLILGNTHQESVIQQIETFGKRRKRTELAKSKLELTERQYQELRWDIRSQTRLAYVQYAFLKEGIKLIRLQTGVAQTLVDISDKKVKAGSAAIVELLQAKLVLSQLQSQQIQVTAELKQAEGQLNTLIGNALYPGIKNKYDILQPDFYNLNKPTGLAPLATKPLPSLQELLEISNKKRPDILAALQQIKVNESQLTLAKAQRIPDLYLAAGYVHVKVKPQFAPDPGRLYYQGVWGQLEVALPIFNRQKYEILKNEVLLKQSHLQVQAVYQQITGEIYDAYQAFEGAASALNFYHNNLLSASTQVLLLAQKSYQYGKTGIANVLLAQQEVQQIRQGYIQAILNYNKAWTNLEKATGMELNL